MATIIPSLNIFPPSSPVLVSGVEFSVTLSSTSPALVSQIVFVAGEGVDGRMLACETRDGSGPATTRSIAIQVQNNVGRFQLGHMF